MYFDSAMINSNKTEPMASYQVNIVKDVVITLSVFVVTFAVGGRSTPPGEGEFDVPALDPFGI